MRKDVAEKWVAALRSGKYEQGTTALCTLIPHFESEETDEQYCCLGVLCEVVQNEPDFLATYPTWGQQQVAGGVLNYRAYGTDEFKTTHEFLPESVQVWAGMGSNDGTFTVDKPNNDDLSAVSWVNYDGDKDSLTLQLSHLNDTGTSFEDIACLIEKHSEVI
jgi:hypothetical protein